MDRNNFNRTRQISRAAVAIAVLALLGYVLRKEMLPGNSSREAGAKPEQPRVALNEARGREVSAPDSVLRIRSDAVLAAVNGHALTAGEVLPPGSSNRPVSLAVCQYFLKRAIDRELILQTAKAQGLQLDDSQRQQLSNSKDVREQPAPGQVRNLNGGASEMAFEMQDAEAFMLQTSLLEKSGASPNVTEEQVTAYYQQHASDFGDLPAEEPDRSQAWESIDVQIRHLLAPDARLSFQNQLTAYMNQIRANANIEQTPLTSFAAMN